MAKLPLVASAFASALLRGVALASAPVSVSTVLEALAGGFLERLLCPCPVGFALSKPVGDMRDRYSSPPLRSDALLENLSPL